MLRNIIKSDTKALANLFSHKKFYRSVNGGKKKYKNYLADLISEDSGKQIVVPKEIIPNLVTSYAFVFSYRKDLSILPILLKYFTRKSLLKEAKEDLDKINQELQDLMDEEVKNLQGEQKMLREEIAELSGKELNVKHSEELAKKSAKITKTASRIEEIKLCKENIKNLFSNEKATSRTYPQKYYSILNDELTKIMEEKLKAYAKDDEADIEKTYQSLNSKAEKITTLRGVKLLAGSVFVAFSAFVPLAMWVTGEHARSKWSSKIRSVDEVRSLCSTYVTYSIIITLSIAAISLAIAGVIHLVNRHYEQSFGKEMQDFIEEPKHVDKATSTENVEEPKQQEKELEVEDLINFSKLESVSLTSFNTMKQMG